MKSKLPLFVLAGGVLVISIVGFAFFNLQSKSPPLPTSQEDEESARELSLEERPYVTLTPDSAGHEVTLSVTRIPSSAETLDYEFVYTAQAQAPATGEVVQGVPGSVDVKDKTSLERQLTLGTCSSGVCRYDIGVKDIKLTIILRDAQGKSLGKFSTGVVLVTKEKEIASTDSNFSVTFDRTPVGYVIVMNTFGLPSDKTPGSLANGPYGVLSSSQNKQKVTVSFKQGIPFGWDGSKWVALENGKSTAPGTFAATQ